MTNAGIEAFLIVCKQHSISKAAELFISQSSLSIRLRTLEKEVGCPLFFRHKGSREMVLTEEGKRFYQLSLQYQDIVRSMLAIGNRKSSLRLSTACPRICCRRCMSSSCGTTPTSTWRYRT